jgi:hypothetical protein
MPNAVVSEAAFKILAAFRSCADVDAVDLVDVMD